MAKERLLPLVFGFFALTIGAGCDEKSAAETSPKASASAAVADVNLEGVDTSTLTPREKREWSSAVTELLAPCSDTPVSIAACVKEKRACKTCVPAAQLLLKQVQAGRAKKDREEAFHARFDANKVKTVPIDDSPSTGATDAPETLVEWADFECPFCKMMSPVLDKIVRRFQGQVRLVYRYYPLQGHAHSEIAARCAVAASNQGKFWEMHKVLFDNQDRLEQEDLEGYAKLLKLDMPKYRAEFVSKEALERIEKDKKAADDLGLDGTPFLWANGRMVDLHLLADPENDLVDWVKLDIELAGKKPTLLPNDPGEAPAASGSAAAGSPSGEAAAAPSASAAAKPPKK
jgi:protein-disulfide isomerase